MGWSALEAVGTQLIGFITLLLLGLYIEPAGFGAFAVAYSIMVFGQILMDSGLSAALIQRRELNAGHLAAVFMLNMIAGVTVAGLLALLALAARHVDGGAAWAPLLLLLSGNCVFLGLNLTQEAYARRELRFRDLAMRRLASVAAGAFAGWYCAARGLGAISLVAQVLTTSLLGTVLLWRFSTWKPTGFRTAWKSLGDLKDFATPLFHFAILKACCMHFPLWILAAFLSHAELGYFNYVSRFAITGVTAIAGSLGGVLFATLSRLQDDHVKYTASYWRSTWISYAASALVALSCFCLLPSFIARTLAPEWSEAVLIARLMPWAGLLACVISPAGALMLSANRPHWMRNWSMAYLLLLCTGAAVGGWWGTGFLATYGLLGANLAGAAYTLEVTHRILGQPRGLLVRRLVVLVLTVAVAVGLWMAWLRWSPSLIADLTVFLFVIIPGFLGSILIGVPSLRGEILQLAVATYQRIRTPARA